MADPQDKGQTSQKAIVSALNRLFPEIDVAVFDYALSALPFKNNLITKLDFLKSFGAQE